MMKYLLVLAVVLAAFYIWRGNRRERMHDAARQAPPPRGTPGTPEAMARCAQCGTHLPTSDAVAGRRGAYCSSAHRDQAEG